MSRPYDTPCPRAGAVTLAARSGWRYGRHAGASDGRGGRGHARRESRKPRSPGRRRPGHHQPRDLRQRRDLPAGARARVRPRLALPRPREPDPAAGRLFRHVHGGGVGHPLPGRGGPHPRVPELVPPPRHEGLPLRRGQYRRVHVSLSRLELWDRRGPGGRALREGRLRPPARPVPLGPHRGPADGKLQGHDLGHVGPRRPLVRRVHRRLQALPRPPARRVGRARGRHRGDRRGPQVADPLQLEIPGRELLRGSLPRRQPPVGRHGRHRSERQGAPRQPGAQRIAAGSTCRSPTSATR